VVAGVVVRTAGYLQCQSRLADRPEPIRVTR
jgi:hypothetical protein